MTKRNKNYNRININEVIVITFYSYIFLRYCPPTLNKESVI